MSFTVAGTQPGGWMQRMKDQGSDPVKPVFSNELSSSLRSETKITARLILTNPDVNRKITLEELEAHVIQGEAWFVVQGEVSVVCLDAMEDINHCG
jgi:nitrate reductase (NAD(P)H)